MCECVWGLHIFADAISFIVFLSSSLFVSRLLFEIPFCIVNAKKTRNSHGKIHNGESEHMDGKHIHVAYYSWYKLQHSPHAPQQTCTENLS